MIIFTVRLTEAENAQLTKLINDFQTANQTPISKNKMIKKLIKEKYNDKEK